MNPRLKKVIHEILSAKIIKLDQKILIFLFFLVLSVVLWVLGALTKNYTTELSYPIEFVKFPSKKYPVGNLPKELKLKVNGYGFTIMKQNLSTSFIPLKIEVNTHPLYKLNPKDTTRFFLLTNTLFSEISSQLSSDMTVMEIFPDSVLFEFTNIINKRVPVKADIKTTFEKQFMQVSNTLIVPDSLDISGPQTTLQNLGYVKTCFKRYKGLNESVNEKICIAEIPGVKFVKDEVMISIAVEKYTEFTLSIPIEIENAPKNLNLRIFPNKVILAFNVALSKYSKINPSQFHASVDYASIQGALGNKIKINITKSPEIIRNMKLSPTYVEFLIEK